MSLARLIAEARSLDMVPLEEQEELTRRVLLPAMAQIERNALRVRQAIDVELRRRPPEIHHADNAADPHAPTASNYPIGQCAAIRDRGFQILGCDPEIRSMISQGLLFKRVYIILKGLYFQNALQLGNVYLDIANDTVEASKPCLEWMPIADVDYVNLEDLDVLANVAERYHRCRVYPNQVFPLLAPVVPFLAVREDGRLDLLDFQDTFFLKDLGDGLKRFRAWLTRDGEWMRRPLPEPYLDALKRRLGANDFQVFPFEFRPCDAGEIAERSREIAQAAGQPGQESLVLTLLKLVPRARRALHQMTIRPSDGS